MEIERTTIHGVYLVIDPAVRRTMLLENVRQALEGGTGLLQVWNHWPEGTGRMAKERLIAQITGLADEYDVPVLINEEWQLLTTTKLAGVHFDKIPEDIDRIRSEAGRDFIAGITCENDLERVRWADEHGLDYISFCAMFPSPSVDSCEIVRTDTVQKARELTDLPLFLSGGITPDRIGELKDLDFNGVAVISGIMDSDDPGLQTRKYNEALTGIRDVQ